MAEIAVAVGVAAVFIAWSARLELYPFDRTAQVSGLAGLQLRYWVLAGVVLVVGATAGALASAPARRLASRLACAATAGLATSVVAGGVALALDGTPWGLGGSAGDALTLAGWAKEIAAGRPLPSSIYPPGFPYLLAWYAELTGGEPAYALKDLQIIGVGLLGPVAYLAWRTVLSPLRALTVGPVAALPLVDAYKPASTLVLAALVPLLVCLVRQVRRAPDRPWRGAVLTGAGVGVGLAALFLLYAGWFLWSAPGVLLALLLVLPWRRPRIPRPDTSEPTSGIHPTDDTDTTLHSPDADTTDATDVSDAADRGSPLRASDAAEPDHAENPPGMDEPDNTFDTDRVATPDGTPDADGGERGSRWPALGRAGLLLAAAAGAFALVAGDYLLALLADAGSTVDAYFYYDTTVDPAYFTAWRGGAGPGLTEWPPRGELGGVGVFPLLLVLGLGVALALGSARTAVLVTALCFGSTWLWRMWVAAEMYQTQNVRLWPRTSLELIYCALVLCALAGWLVADRVRGRAPDGAVLAPETGGTGRWWRFRIPPAASPLLGVVAALLLLFASAGSAMADRHLPSRIQKGGGLAFRAQTTPTLEGGCPRHTRPVATGPKRRLTCVIAPDPHRPPAPPPSTPTPR